MTNDTAAPAPAPRFWRRLWNFLEACEMSTAAYGDRRIGALERRIAALEREARERADRRDPQERIF